MTISKWNEPSLEHDQEIQQVTTAINTNDEILASQPTLLTVNQLCLVEPALTTGGVRHLLFTKGHNLPGVYRFGRKLLFDRAEFMIGIKKGYTATISGRAHK